MAQLFHINSVLITGANRGLGLKLVEVLLNADSPPKHIFACYRDAAKAAVMHLFRILSQSIFPKKV